MVRCGNWFIAIENKIKATSVTPGQLAEQYQGLRQVLQQQNQTASVLMLYLIPAIRTPGNEGAWKVCPEVHQELSFEPEEGDRVALLNWQPTKDAQTVSLVELIQEILEQVRCDNIAPIRSEVQQCLASFVHFALDEFRGYPVAGVAKQTRTVANILKSQENLFVSIGCGMETIVCRAWKKPECAFAQEKVTVTYVPMQNSVPYADFVKLATWAMKPDTPLSGIAWSGRPFYTATLYRVAKAAGDNIFIAIRGGASALTAPTIRQGQN